MLQKNLSIVIGMALLALPALAKDPGYQEVKLHEMKTNEGINQYDDACYGCPIKISFPAGNLKKGPLYRIELKGSVPDASCTIISATKSKGISSIFITANVETDSGDACEVHVLHPNGKRTVLSIEEAGT